MKGKSDPTLEDCWHLVTEGQHGGSLIHIVAMWETLKFIKTSRPFIHCLSSFVSMDLIANGLIAVGACPVMIFAEGELSQTMFQLSKIENKTIFISIGTIDVEWTQSFSIAVQYAKKYSIEWILETVGVGFTKARTDAAHKLMNIHSPTLIWGTGEEIKHLALACGAISEREFKTQSLIFIAQSLAKSRKCAVCYFLIFPDVVVVNPTTRNREGDVVMVTDGQAVYEVRQSAPILGCITALRSLAGGIIGCFLACRPKSTSVVECVSHAVTFFSICASQTVSYICNPDEDNFTTTSYPITLDNFLSPDNKSKQNINNGNRNGVYKNNNHASHGSLSEFSFLSENTSDLGNGTLRSVFLDVLYLTNYKSYLNYCQSTTLRVENNSNKSNNYNYNNLENKKTESQQVVTKNGNSLSILNNRNNGESSNTNGVIPNYNNKNKNEILNGGGGGGGLGSNNELIPQTPMIRQFFHSKNKSIQTIGVVGLINLGNTCYLNASIQCLSNTPLFCRFFLTDQFENHLRRSNPVKDSEKFIRGFATLMRSIWIEDNVGTTLDLSEFKELLCRLAPEFAGQEYQHDSQEVLSFMIDQLNEGLKYKKTEIKDNSQMVTTKSMIQDFFQGKLKNRITCPKCDYTTENMNPFMILSIPLPPAGDRTFQINLFLNNSTIPTQFKVNVSCRRTCFELIHIIREKCQIGSQRNLLIFESQKIINQPIDVGKSVDQLSQNSVLNVYEIGKPEYSQKRERHICVNQTLVFASKSKAPLSVGYPFLVRFVSNLTTAQNIHEEIRKHLNLHFKNEFDSKKFDEEHIYSVHATYMDNSRMLLKTQTTEIIDENETLSLFWNEKAILKYENLYRNIKDWSKQFKKIDSDPQNIVTLTDCFRYFEKEEILGESNTWKCSSCTENQQAKVQTQIVNLPIYLFIQLKRFHYVNFRREKITCLVDFPFELQLKTYTSLKHDITYDLYAVLYHEGDMSEGHSVTCAKNFLDDKWYMFDDSTCSQVSESEIVSENAYVLCYKQQQTAEASGTF